MVKGILPLTSQKCIKCQRGELVFTGTALLSFPPYYVHKCTYCGKVYELREIFPNILEK